jgi:PST family polysaccharide transporter
MPFRYLEKYLPATFLSNLKNLGIIQVANALHPFLILPYLTRTVGVDLVGLAMLGQTIMTYFSVLCEYGFNLSGTRDVALHRDNPAKLSEIFFSVYAIKTGIFFCCLLGFWVYHLLFPVENFFLFFSAFGIIAAQILNPFWFYQGLDNLKTVKNLSLIGKMVSVGLTFLFIREKEDFILINFFWASGNVVLGFIYSVVTIKNLHLKFEGIRWSVLMQYFKEGRPAFITNFLINIELYSPTLFLSQVVSPFSFGCFSIAEKIISLFRVGLAVFFQATFSAITRLRLESFSAMKAYFRQVFRPFAWATILACLMAIPLAGPVYSLVAGHAHPDGIFSMRIMAFSPVWSCLSIPVFQVMLAYGFNRSYLISYFCSAAFALGSGWYFPRFWGIAGTAWSVMLTDMVLLTAIFLIFSIRHKDYKLFA